MESIIQNIDFSVGRYSCGYSLFYNIFSNYGYEISETDIYFLGNGMAFDIIPDGKYNFGYSSMKDVILNMKNSITDKIDFYSGDDKKYLENKMLEEVSAGNMIALYVYADCLEHHDIKAIRYPFHLLAVYGVDTVRRTAYIGDSYIVNDKGQASLYMGKADLDKIMSSTKEFAVFKNTGKVDISRKTVFDSVLNSINVFLNYEYKDGLLIGNSGLKKFVRDIDELVRFNEPIFNQYHENIAAALKWISLGPMMKNIMNLFDENEELRVKDYEMIIDEFQKIESEWIKFSLNIIKLGYSPKKDKIGVIIENCNNLIGRQESALAGLYEHIKTSA
ncbi:MAG: BtrH N-terminal domain-containing protein [Clostridia bacterium]|nr:BtrH N-terminal domain-containing protein [Clostridia bacterium]